MDEKIKVLLNKINIDNINYQYFSVAKLSRLQVISSTNEWIITIENDEMLPVNILQEIEEKKKLLSTTASEITIKYIFKNKNINTYLEYYSLVLKQLKEELRVLNIYEEALKLEENKLILVVSTSNEYEKLKNCLPKFNNLYNNLGYIEKIEVVERRDVNIQEEITKELAPKEVKVEKKKEEEVIPQAKPTYNKKEAVDPKNIIGRGISENPIPIKTLLGEDDNVVVEAHVFAVDYFESTKTDFKIITLKITDYTDSIYCKVFVRNIEEYQRLCSILKPGKWLKIRGYTKNDSFAREIVLNARDIILLEKEEEQVKDTAEEKRVELHAHTIMSQMDGLADDVELVKQAISFGHKGIAITDHNGVQSFPHVYGFVKKHNKGKEEKDKFKVAYGAELELIDDSINIVIRENDLVMLEQEFVVFDFETTGFNAGGSDSIIEIGAVKIKNGQITDKFNELINPMRKLPQKIIDITHITDAMLKDKDIEENAIKRFKEWYGDAIMVAHNAKFDVSFLEMAYSKYQLGKFTNTVIDTLELSRTLDNNYARHSLTALVKRYEVPWDENAHHRADYDAEGTALVFHKMLNKLSNRNIETVRDLNKLVSQEEIHKYGRSYHVNILVKNATGLKNLFKIISLASTKYLYKTPRILRSALQENREGLLVGSGCYLSEVFVEGKSKSEDELSNIIRFYDYVEVQPPECYNHLIQDSSFGTELELGSHIEKIIRVTKEAGKIMVATGDVHHIKKEDKIYREIIVNQKVPGGGRHPLARKNIKEIPSNHFRTTSEMLNNFKFLNDDELIKEIVITNPNKIINSIEEYEVIKDTGGVPFSPIIEDSVKTATNLVFETASNMYGNPLPYNIEERISKELYGDKIFEVIKYNLKKENLSEEEIKKESYKKLHDNLLLGLDNVKNIIKNYLLETEPEVENIDKVVNKSLGGIIGGGFDVIYLISQKLVKKSNDDGYLVGSRGSVGSSFVATLMGITEVNPLPAHYLCKNENCKYSEFINPDTNETYGLHYSSGYDLDDKVCPHCNEKLGKEGQDMPFATFLGFNADKVPDIDLNFSGDYQPTAHAYTKELFGEDYVYKAGTIGTVAEKTAFGFVKGYLEEKEIGEVRNAEIERLASGCTGVKRTTGQHPGGIVVIPGYMDVFDFTPFQFPADDNTKDWRTTHFDYHAIDENVLKLDILGHDDPTVLRMLQDLSGIDVTKLPMDDKKVYSLLSSPEALGLTEDQIFCATGTLGLPELGTKFVVNMLKETKPKNFSELVKISGLSHGTDVWAGNASELIEKNIVPFKEVIGCRDDIMVSLMNWGVKPLISFKIMEFVRKGRASKDPEGWKEYEQIMKDANIPEWYIESCFKIKYMFPKAHACAYVMSAIRIAWFKLYHPLYYYAAFFSIRVDDFDIETMIKGYDSIKAKIEDLISKGYEASNKELNIIESLKIALEATARGITFGPIDLERSDSKRFKLDDKNPNTLIPPFSTIDGLGESVAEKIVEERKNKPFLSKEDVSSRGKVSKTLIEKMTNMGILTDMPDSNQLSLF